jgi:hypothetical protein
MELSGEINSVAIINGQQMYLSLLKRNTHFYVKLIKMPHLLPIYVQGHYSL